MRKRIIFLFSIMVPMICVGQRSDETIYYMWINKLDRSTSHKGYLIGLEDNYIIHINKSRNYLDSSQNSPRKTAIPINTIESLAFRKSGKAGNGIWKGALWGGGILGFIAVGANDGFFNSGGAFIIGFIAGAVPGALIGTAIGSKKMHFYLNGDKTTYQKQKEKLKQFLME